MSERFTPPSRKLGVLPGQWWYILSLYGPLLAVDVLLQAARAHTLGVPIGSLAFIDSLRPTLSFGLAVIVGWVLLVRLTKRRSTRLLVVVAFHVTFTVLAVLVVLNHLYFLKADLVLSRNSLDLLPLIFDAQIGELLAGEVNLVLLLIAAILILLANVLPILVNRRFPPRALTRVTGRPHLTARPVVALLLAVALGGTFSVVPDLSDFDRSNRNRAVAILIDIANDATASKPPGFQTPTKTDLLHGTSLTGDPTGPRNVVLILMESVSATATDIHNPSRSITPNLAGLVDESIVFDNAYTVIPHTTKALIASLCGVTPPIETFDQTASKPGGIVGNCLPELLNEKGYSTAYFQSATAHFEERDEMMKNFGFQASYPLEKLDKTGFSEVNSFGYEDDIMVEPSLDWARSQRNPFFMSYLTVTTHYDYKLPKDFAEKHYSDDPVENRYLNAVRYTDAFVGKLIDGFKRAGLYDNTIFIITGDHGEAFYEHGRRSHNNVIWTEGLHIPMVINTPESRRAPSRITKPVQLPAILPTVADLLGYGITGGTYPQPSMLSPVEQPLFATCWDEEQCVSLIEGNRKFNHFFGYRPDEYFDLANDPLEKDNLIDQLSQAQVDDKIEQTTRWLAETQALYRLSRRAAVD